MVDVTQLQTNLATALRKRKITGADKAPDLIDAIQDELMKKGTLAHNQIDWEVVWDSSMKLLAIGAYSQALRGGTLASLQFDPVAAVATNLTVLNKVFDAGLDALLPSDKKYGRLKKAHLQECIDTMAKAFQQDGLLKQAPDFDEMRSSTIALLEKAKAQGLDVAAAKKSIEEVRQAPTRQSGDNSSGSGKEVHQTDLDAKERAQLKRDALALADRIFAFRPNEPAPYVLRAFAATMELNEAPEANAKGVTAQNAMPKSIYDQHARAQNHPNLSGLAELENRLVNSPDWFEGQLLAYHIALTLDYPLAADAIATRISWRLKKLPQLQGLKYSNGAEIVPKEVLDLVRTQGQEKTAEEGAKERASFEEEIQAKGLKEGLAAIEDLAKTVRTKREKAELALLRAELLFEEGLAEFAKSSLDPVLKSFENESLQEWDRTLYEKVLSVSNRKV